MVRHRSLKAAEPTSDYAADLSQGGLFIRTQRRPTLGEIFEVEMTPPASAQTDETKVIKATCQVARVTPDGVGAHFTQLDSDSALLLNLLLSV